jgi:hypothetical protein
MDHTALRDGLHRYSVEIPVLPEPLQEIFRKDRPARAPSLAAQVFYIRIPEAGLTHPVQKPLKPGIDTIPCLVETVIRTGPEEMIELRLLLVKSGPEIELGLVS